MCLCIKTSIIHSPIRTRITPQIVAACLRVPAAASLGGDSPSRFLSFCDDLPMSLPMRIKPHATRFPTIDQPLKALTC